MRILQVVVGYHPARGEFGGIVETVEHLSRGLVARGHEVEVWTSALVGRGRPLVHADVTALHDGVPVRYFETWHPARLGYGFAFSPSMARAFRREISGFDVVHVNGYRNHIAVSAVLAALEARVPYVLQTHGTIPTVVHRVRTKRLFDRLLGRTILGGAAALLAISRSEAQLFAPHGIDPATVEVVYNGVDEGMIGADLGPGDWYRRELGIDAPEVLLYLGRLHERKGVQHLVAAFAALAPRRPGAHLVIIGSDDGYQGELERRIAASGVADRITLAGPRYGLAKYRAYRSAALLVYPAVHEFFGLVPFEALLCGTPAVVAEGEGCAEVLEDVGGGWTVPWDDATALATTIERALDERATAPGPWLGRVAHARARILERYSWRAVTEHVLRIYTRAREARR